MANIGKDGTGKSIIENDKHKSIKKINISDEFIINGRIYIIPDRYIEHLELPYEYKKLYKFILASLIDKNIEKGNLKNITKITKILLNQYIIICDKLFSFIITGKLNSIQFSNLETELINKIPFSLIPKLNPNIIERLE